ncbi:MAG: glycosyltransferase family 4 protein [Candidatus Bathyarchaeota archaeon]|nr:glycosyltransferase family 4 protein [Candidatus Bathyarchaeota archaeon]
MRDMKICYVSPEIFHWGTYGGFGYLTRLLAKKLAEKDIDVSVVTQRRPGQNEYENLDGFKVYGYPPHQGTGFGSLSARRDSIKYYQKADADIYHSQAVSYNTYAAYIAEPEKKHIITFQDPYDWDEWRRIAKVIPKYGTLKHQLRVEAEIRILAETCRKMDRLYSQAHFLIPKAIKLYKLETVPEYLPNPVPVPETVTEKAARPTVCFLARWDPQKRVELFLCLAEKYPDIDFIAMGKSHDPEKDQALREKYGNISNLTLTGFISEHEKQEILGKSWALLNTSIREALPVSFLEALANETPVISGENPDNLVSDYGYHVMEDDYEAGLAWLMDSHEWQHKGKNGRRHVARVYDSDHVADLHIEEYTRITEASG